MLNLLRKSVRLAGAAIVAIGLAGSVGLISAQPAAAASAAVATTNVNLRAGPGTNYPVVTAMPRGASLAVYGCLAGYTWCDVSWGPSRGWVAANYVQVAYQGRPVVLTPALAPAIGLTVVAFNQAYWNTYYANRPWYGQWNRYYAPPRGAYHSGATGCVRGPNGAGCGHVGTTVGPNGGYHKGRTGCVRGPNGGGCGHVGTTTGPWGNTVTRGGGVRY